LRKGAERLAGTLLSAVNDPKNAFDNLAGNPAFEPPVTEQSPMPNGTSEASMWSTPE
jgi:hypothetical protein